MKSGNKVRFDLGSKNNANLERYGILMQASSECTCDFNIKTDELYLSETFFSVFGLSPISLKKNKDFFLSRIHPDDLERVHKEYESALKESSAVNFNVEYRLLKGDGDYAYVQSKVILLRDEKKEAYRLLNVVKDVTSDYFYQQIESIEREIMVLSM